MEEKKRRREESERRRDHQREHVHLRVQLSKEDVVRLRAVGRGQNGSVVKALHLPSLARVALKSINVYDQSTRRQMIKELTAYASLSSPFILSFLGAYFDPAEGNIVLASEYMDCGSLQKIVEEKGVLPESALRHVARQMIEGLQYLHSQYALHRDIKPDNVLCNHSGDIKIADFGLVKELKNTIDATDSFLGTMAYLAPERLTSAEYSFPSDIWALGLSILFCGTGKLSMESYDYWEMVDLITNHPPPSLPKSQFSEEIRSFVADCLYADPTQRATLEVLLKHPFLHQERKVTQTQSGEETYSVVETDEAEDRKEFQKYCDPDRQDLSKIFELAIERHELDLNSIPEKTPTRRQPKPAPKGTGGDAASPRSNSESAEEVVDALAEQFGLTNSQVRTQLRFLMEFTGQRKVSQSRDAPKERQQVPKVEIPKREPPSLPKLEVKDNKMLSIRPLAISERRGKTDSLDDIPAFINDSESDTTPVQTPVDASKLSQPHSWGTKLELLIPSLNITPPKAELPAATTLGVALET